MGRKKLPDAVLKKREKDVIALRAENYPNKDIAGAMGLLYTTVMKLVGRLIKQGRLTCYRPGRRPSPESERGENSPRFKTIVKMVRRRATLKEIGAAISTTGERARQLIAKMREEHGDAIFQPKKKMLWTLAEAVTEVGASRRTIAGLCDNGTIPFLQRGKKQRLFNAKGLSALKKHPSITRKRVCDECGRMFILPKTAAFRKTCSNECAQKRHRRFHAIWSAQEKPSAESLRGWRAELLQRLNSHTIGNDEQWMSSTDACLRAGISSMQLHWLRYRHILTIRPHPTNKGRTGSPVALYAASELDIVRQVYQANTPIVVR